MTDTPRTEEELLTIFEDGQIGTISAQDMRDMVVSVGGKLDKTQAFSIYCNSQSIPVAHSTNLYLPVDVNHSSLSGTLGQERSVFDPNGYASVEADDPEPWGGVPGGRYLKGLPQGSLWVMQVLVSFARGTFDDSDALQVAAGYPSPDYPFPDDYLEDTAGGIFGAPTYAYTANETQYFGPSLTTHNLWSGMATLPLYADDRFDLWNLASGYALQVSGDVQTVQAFEVDAWRIR